MTISPEQEYFAKQLRGEYAKKLKELQFSLRCSIQLEKQYYSQISLKNSNIKDGGTSWFKAFISFFILCPLSLFLGWKYLGLFFFLITIYFIIEFAARESSASEQRMNYGNPNKNKLKALLVDQKKIMLEIEETIKSGIVERHMRAEQSLIDGNQDPLDKKEFVEASRSLLEFQRGDTITIYDESRIQNDLEALTIKASYNVHGDLMDNRKSIHIDQIHQSYTIYEPPKQSNLETEADVKREILKLIHSSSSHDASLIDLMSEIKSHELLIRQALDSLMIQGLVQIGNREDGVISYKIDYLAE